MNIAIPFKITKQEVLSHWNAPVYLLKVFWNNKKAYAHPGKQTTIKADVSLTSTSEKHIVNLATIFWPFEQASQEANSGITQVQYDPQIPIYLVLYSSAEDRCVSARRIKGAPHTSH